jgi:hypothetical protein
MSRRADDRVGDDLDLPRVGIPQIRARGEPFLGIIPFVGRDHVDSPPAAAGTSCARRSRVISRSSIRLSVGICRKISGGGGGNGSISAVISIILSRKIRISVGNCHGGTRSGISSIITRIIIISIALLMIGCANLICVIRSANPRTRFGGQRLESAN